MPPAGACAGPAYSRRMNKYASISAPPAPQIRERMSWTSRIFQKIPDYFRSISGSGTETVHFCVSPGKETPDTVIQRYRREYAGAPLARFRGQRCGQEKNLRPQGPVFGAKARPAPAGGPQEHGKQALKSMGKFFTKGIEKIRSRVYNIYSGILWPPVRSGRRFSLDSGAG